MTTLVNITRVKTRSIFTLLCAFAVPSIAMANVSDHLYGTAQLGYSLADSDSQAYGNNIANDKDFPSSFDADDSVVGGIGLGYAINQNLRIEGRLATRKFDINDTRYGTGAREGEQYLLDGEMQSVTMTVEGFYDFPMNASLTPYVKAGIGLSSNEYEARLGGTGVAGFDVYDGKADGYYDNYTDGDSNEFSWNVGAGASYALTPSTRLYGEYQYINFGDVQTGQDSFSDGFEVDNASAHEINLGLRYQF